MFQIDPLSLIPDSLKTAVRDAAVDFVSDQAKKLLGEELGGKIKKLRSDAGFAQKFDIGLQKALQRFVDEYAEQDEDLAAAISADANVFKNEQVEKALLEMLKNPGKYLEDEHETVAESFATVLPGRKNRERVDKAMAYLLRCLAEEMWNLPELQPIYSLQFQRMTAESMRQQVEIQKAQLQALTTVNEGVRQALLQLTDAIAEKKLLPEPDALVVSMRPKVLHNLPHPSYDEFIGREKELVQISSLLATSSRHFIITIDGIGGIGKSAIALESAHRYLRNYDSLAELERFDAIIWTSAKLTILTADGILTRPQALKTLDDIYSTIAMVLGKEDILRSRLEEQHEMIRGALSQMRVLLIVDNLETVDDESVMVFLRELPPPTKAIVTTRHRVDIAYPIRLMGMDWDDALRLIEAEASKKSIQLSTEESRKLYERTGGVPLALVWSISQIGYGYSVQSVLTRLGQPTSDISRFCFNTSLSLVKVKPAYQMLLALSLFTPDANRQALGFVSELPELDRDDGLGELEKLSLVNKKGSRFSLLPLARVFALGELEQSKENQLIYQRRWVNYLKQISKGSDGEYYWRYKNYDFFDDAASIAEAIEWAYTKGTANDVFDLLWPYHTYLNSLGRYNEILNMCDRSISIASAMKSYCVIARLLIIKGMIYRHRGDNKEAQNLFQGALSYYQLANNKEGLCIALRQMSMTEQRLNHIEESIKLCEQAFSLAEQLDNKDYVASIRIQFGFIHLYQNDYSAAWEDFAWVKNWSENRVSQAPLDEPLAQSALGNLAIVAYKLGKYEETKEFSSKTIEFFEKKGGRAYLIEMKYWLAMAEEALGEYESAYKHATEALEGATFLGMLPRIQDLQSLFAKIKLHSSNKN